MKNYKIAKISSNIYSKNNYSNTNYTGLAKFLYYFNHKILSLKVDNSYNNHIIEIGGGAKPHINFMDISYVKEYTIVDDLKYKTKLKKLSKQYKNIKFKFINYKNLKLPKKKFTRLIASHTFEHFKNFEEDFLKILSSLKPDSLISIALPCDPGSMWRLLQYLYYFKQKKNYGWKNFAEKDLSHARDHLTPVQNIQKIIRFYFKRVKNYYFPFLIPSINLNIFLIIQLKMKDFKNYNN